MTFSGGENIHPGGKVRFPAFTSSQSYRHVSLLCPCPLHPPRPCQPLSHHFKRYSLIACSSPSSLPYILPFWFLPLQASKHASFCPSLFHACQTPSLLFSQVTRECQGESARPKLADTTPDCLRGHERQLKAANAMQNMTVINDI